MSQLIIPVYLLVLSIFTLLAPIIFLRRVVLRAGWKTLLSGAGTTLVWWTLRYPVCGSFFAVLEREDATFREFTLSVLWGTLLCAAGILAALCGLVRLADRKLRWESAVLAGAAFGAIRIAALCGIPQLGLSIQLFGVRMTEIGLLQGVISDQRVQEILEKTVGFEPLPIALDSLEAIMLAVVLAALGIIVVYCWRAKNPVYMIIGIAAGVLVLVPTLILERLGRPAALLYLLIAVVLAVQVILRSASHYRMDDILSGLGNPYKKAS